MRHHRPDVEQTVLHEQRRVVADIARRQTRSRQHHERPAPAARNDRGSSPSDDRSSLPSSAAFPAPEPRSPTPSSPAGQRPNRRPHVAAPPAAQPKGSARSPLKPTYRSTTTTSPVHNPTKVNRNPGLPYRAARSRVMKRKAALVTADGRSAARAAATDGAVRRSARRAGHDLRGAAPVTTGAAAATLAWVSVR